MRDALDRKAYELGRQTAFNLSKDCIYGLQHGEIFRCVMSVTSEAEMRGLADGLQLLIVDLITQWRGDGSHPEKFTTREDLPL